MAINTDKKSFDDCVILAKEAFDPDAVFLDDIVDDEVLPYLSLDVDGLTTAREGRKGNLELRPDDVAANEPITPDTTMPVATLEPDQLEVYGWESSLVEEDQELYRFWDPVPFQTQSPHDF